MRSSGDHRGGKDLGSRLLGAKLRVMAQSCQIRTPTGTAETLQPAACLCPIRAVSFNPSDCNTTSYGQRNSPDLELASLERCSFVCF